jgi:SAM-dependent methyltransferase
MHDTASDLGSLFFATYLDSSARLVLDVGSMDVNGSLRDHAPPTCMYVGIDLSPGPGVDLVLDNPYTYPFRDEYFDAIVSTSCFEHDQLFWLSFIEMIRVTKPGGYIYINCPSNGGYHGYPFDNWRFYPDAGLALEAWAKYQNKPITLVESFIAYRKIDEWDQWNDCVMVFFKGSSREISSKSFISDKYRCYNIRRYSSEGLSNFSGPTEDMLLLANARQAIARGVDCGITAGGNPPQDEGASVLTLESKLAAGEKRITALKEQLAMFDASMEVLQKSTGTLIGSWW